MININGKINIYIRKENKLENLKTGYGRLQWLKYELEDNKETVNIFVDEYKKCSKMIELIKEIQEGSIDNLLIWSIDDIVLNIKLFNVKFLTLFDVESI